jgi:hypothetical protein
MALTTYTGLNDAVADWLNRADLASRIPDFIELATARISRDMARIRHPRAIARATATVTSNYAPLPANYIAMYQLMDQDNAVVLEYVTPDQSRELLADTGVTAGAFYFTILGNTIRVIPPPSTTAPNALDQWYYAKVPALSESVQENWVLTRYPDLYLYGSLVHSAPYLKADERIAVWEGAYQKIIQELEIEADRANRPQSKLVAARKSF